MRSISTYGHIKSGKLLISYRSKFDQAIGSMPDCRVEVVVKKLHKKRSTEVLHDDGSITRGQNGYYHTIIVEEYKNGAWDMQQRILNHDEAHEELKFNCSYIERFNDETGEVMRFIQSTACMTTIEFEEYLGRCREFIREWYNIDCPLPGEQTELEFKSN